MINVEWPKLKSSFLFEQVPVLEVLENGRNYTIAQSGAIGNFNIKPTTHIRLIINILGSQIILIICLLKNHLNKNDINKNR